MNFKIIVIGNEARDKAIKGANLLADATKMTLGPFGKNALMEKGQKITNDGVTISREIASGIKDELERRGALTLHEAAAKTNDIAGDGTTTSLILAQSILKEATALMGSGNTIASKKTASDVIKTIAKEKEEIIEKLTAKAQPIETEQELINSAIVSVEDKELGELIGKAQWKLGKDGVLTSEETAERISSVEYVNGIRIDNGFGTSLVMNNQEKQCLEVNNTQVILTNFVFNASMGITTSDPNNGFVAPLYPLLKQLYQSGKRDVVIMARAFSELAIKDCIENCNTGFHIIPINAPYVDQNEVMKDLAAVLGGTYFNAESSKLENMQLSDVGFARRIVAKLRMAEFTGEKDEHSEERLKNRLKELEKRLKGSQSEFEKKMLLGRIAQLTSGYGIIKVGANSDTERKYKKDKAEDCCNAVKAALQEGVVDGGGLAYKQIAETLPDTYILKRPLMSIYEQIFSTAPQGFEIESWIKDPVKVLRVALEEACSVASVFASVGIVIAFENPESLKDLFKK